MRVGFAGLGRMGLHMARNLADAGHELMLWNRTSAIAQSLADELNCSAAATPRALADQVDIVVTMLADDPASDVVHLGADGLFFGLRAKYYIEMGTMSPDHIGDLVASAPEGVTVIDAPVSGSTQAAEAAQLLIMAGCMDATAKPLMSVFDAIGRHVICLEKTGAGAVMKLAVNAMIHGINQNFAEAMTLAVASGIAPERAFDVIEASAACAPMLKYRRPLYLNETAHDVTFTVALARKDMAAAADLAHAKGVPLPQGEITLSILNKAMNAGFADRDMASILNYMRGVSQ